MNDFTHMKLLIDGTTHLIIPFTCQKCGECCRVYGMAFFGPCKHQDENNLCTAYERRPHTCRSFPILQRGSAREIQCPGFMRQEKMRGKLGQGIPYYTTMKSVYSEEEKAEWLASLPKMSKRRWRLFMRKLRKMGATDEEQAEFTRLNLTARGGTK